MYVVWGGALIRALGIFRVVRSMKIIATLLLMTAAITSWQNLPAYAWQQESKAILGTVVAYDHLQSLTACYHICGGSVIIRIDEPGSKLPRYIRVNFKYPDGKFPHKLVESKAQYRLRLERAADRDSPLTEFIPMVDEKSGERVNSNLPAWRLVPGAEDEKLPFGETLPAYALVGDVFKLKEKK